MALSTAQLSLIEQRVANDSPSIGAAYLLWLFTWFVSGHRFYLGRPGTAILQILTYFILVGFVWLLVDAFLMPGMIQEKKDTIRQRMTTELLAHSGTVDGGLAQ
jgi:TM2 domain-containing membrane protein YozV